MTLKRLNEAKYSIPTRLIYGKSVTDAWDYEHHVVPPLTKSSTFRLESAKRGAEGFGAIAKKNADDPGSEHIYVYDRMGEPNTLMLEQAIAISEQKEIAVCFSSGMSAVSAAVCSVLERNSSIISHRTIYGCSYSLFTDWLPKMGHEVTFCDFTNPDSFLSLLKPETKVIYLESPANPTLELLDIEAIMKRVHEINLSRPESQKLVTIIDNTFATPFCQRPGNFGVDMIVHSLTKGLCGFGTVMGGAVATQRSFQQQLLLFRKDFGATLAPDSAWHVMVYGISTLAIRVRKQQENASRIAHFLEAHPEVETVLYPGLQSFPQHDIAKRIMRDYDGNFAPGMMIYFTLKGESAEASKRRGELLIDFIATNSYCITLAVSLGQLRTLIEHPGSMTHAAYPAEEQIKRGLHPGGIRLAVGIENAEDIILDLEESLNFIKTSPSDFQI